MNLTDDMLRDAAADVRKAMLDSVSTLDKNNHTFSPRFERKMRSLLHQHKAGYTLFQRVAVMFLILLVGSGVWLAVDVNASSVFLKWIQNVYENSVVYQFFGNIQEKGTFTGYSPTWLPEGYVEMDTIATDSQIVVEYRNANDETIYFQSMELDEHTQEEIVLDGMENPVNVTINGMHGIFYQAIDITQSNELLWFDTEHDIAFSLHSYLEKSIMLRIAESVSLGNLTN